MAGLECEQKHVQASALHSGLGHTLTSAGLACRTWKTDLPRGMCALVSLSVEHEDTQLMGGVRAVVMDSQYLIEPCGSGKSRLTHLCRIDLK